VNHPLSAALQYLASGKSVFPVIITPDGKKRPLVKWKRFQTRLPTSEEACCWWMKWPEAAIGMVTGSISGCCVLDVDPRNGGDLRGQSLPAGPCSQTMHGGNHHFFKSPPTPLQTRSNILPGIDFKGEGGFVVLSPTPGYRWIQELSGELPELLSWIIKAQRHPKRVRQTRMQVPCTDVVRFLPNLNAEGWKRRLHWPMIIWYLLRVLDQERGGDSLVPYDQAIGYLLDRGFKMKKVEELLNLGVGIFWDFQWKRDGVCAVIHLRGIGRVAARLEVDIRSPYDKEMNRLPVWQMVPVCDFTADKALAYFRSIACYDPEERKISRAAIADRSGISPKTQVRDADKLGLLKKRGRRRLQGIPTYTPNLDRHGPRTLQECSILKGVASRGPVGLLGWVSRRIEGKSFKTPVGGSATPEPVQASPPAIHPWRWFRSDGQYDQSSDRAAEGILASLTIDDNAEVPMTPAEVAREHLRRSVSLWRRPARVVMAELIGMRIVSP